MYHSYAIVQKLGLHKVRVSCIALVWTNGKKLRVLLHPALGAAVGATSSSLLLWQSTFCLKAGGTLDLEREISFVRSS